jgi:hypothetical protein
MLHYQLRRASRNPAELLKVYDERRCDVTACVIVEGKEEDEEMFTYVLQWAKRDCIASIREFMERLLEDWDYEDTRNRRRRASINEIAGDRLVMFLETMWAKIQHHVLLPHQQREWLRQVMRVEVKRRNLMDVLLTGILSRPTEAKVAMVDLVERVEAIGPNKELNRPHDSNILNFERAKLQVRDPRFVKFERTYKRHGMAAADREYCWDTRKPYLSLMAGVWVDAPFLRYLHTEFAMHEICSFMEDVPYNYIVVEKF